MRAEWQGFREHDVVFLVCIEAPLPDAVAKLVEFERYIQYCIHCFVYFICTHILYFLILL